MTEISLRRKIFLYIAINSDGFFVDLSRSDRLDFFVDLSRSDRLDFFVDLSRIYPAVTVWLNHSVKEKAEIFFTDRSPLPCEQIDFLCVENFTNHGKISFDILCTKVCNYRGETSL